MISYKIGLSVYIPISSFWFRFNRNHVEKKVNNNYIYFLFFSKWFWKCQIISQIILVLSFQRCIQNPVELQRWNVLGVNYFCKTFYLRFLTDFWIPCQIILILLTTFIFWYFSRDVNEVMLPEIICKLTRLNWFSWSFRFNYKHGQIAFT